MKKSHAQQACFHPVIGQLLFVGGFSSHQLSPIHIYQELGAKRKVEISSIFHFVYSFSLHILPISSPRLPLAWFSVPQKHRNKKLRICSLPIRLPHKPPPHKSLGRTWVHQIQYQTPKFSSHPYQSSCLFLKIWQCYIIIMLCRSGAAVHQDEWNKSQSRVSARSVIWKLCLFS